MAFSVYVFYYRGEDTKFDLNYYLTSHMPLVQSRWTKNGLKSWEVIEFAPGGDGKAPKSYIQTVMVFDGEESFAAAVSGPDAGEILGDIANFTNTHPEICPGVVVGSSSS
jgi:uncharacterized protein (TIGR02118 family)